MASSTTNLGLRKPDLSENWSVQDDFNANMQKIDDFAGNANRAVITNQYSNIVDAINAFRTVKTFPFTIQKYGNASYGGLPSGVTATCEWNVLCIGDALRLTAIFVGYSGASNNNLTVWVENLYNGSVNMSWRAVNGWIDITSSFTVNSSVCQDFKAYTDGHMVHVSMLAKTGAADQNNLVSNIAAAYRAKVDYSNLQTFCMNGVDLPKGACATVMGGTIQLRINGSVAGTGGIKVNGFYPIG